MGKQTRKQKREEEKKILAQMDEAMQESSENSEKETPKQGWKGLLVDKTPEKVHCRKCGTYIEDGVCPSCGFRVYVPMDKKTQQNIRLVLGGICLVIFAVLFFWTQLK